MATISVGANKPLIRLKKRKDFLRVTRQGAKAVTVGYIVFATPPMGDGEDSPMRIGFTCSKKLGNAVTRNRAKRRLRALADECLPIFGQSGWDYVLIGRFSASVSLPFDKMKNELVTALAHAHQTYRKKTARDKGRTRCANNAVNREKLS